MTYYSEFQSQCWDKCFAEMPRSMMARELLQSYHDLEDLYWLRILRWVLMPFRKEGKNAYRTTCMRVIEKQVEIKQLGGKVPPFWSLS